MDRISELPKHILIHILSFLPTREVARTSLVSKRWRNLWIWVTTIDLIDPNVFAGFNIDALPSNTTMLNICNNLLGTPSHPIQTLRLKFRNQDIDQLPDLELWLKSAIKRGLTELSIKGITHIFTLKIWSVIASNQLRILQLSTSYLLDSPIPFHLPSLKFLDLEIKYPVVDTLNQFLSPENFPALETLHLNLDFARVIPVEMDVFYCLRIISPTLKNLKLIIARRTPDHSIEMETPALQFIIIKDLNNLVSIEGGMLPELKTASFNINFGSQFPFDMILDHPLDKFAGLKCVSITIRPTLCIPMVLFYLRFLPRLTTLIISSSPFEGLECFKPSKSNEYEIPTDSFRSLKKVTLDGFYGYGCEMNLLKMIALHAKSVTEVLVNFGVIIHDVREYYYKKIKRLPWKCNGQFNLAFNKFTKYEWDED